MNIDHVARLFGIELVTPQFVPQGFMLAAFCLAAAYLAHRLDAR